MVNYRNTAIKDIGTVVTGKTPPTANPEYYNGPYMFVTPAELHGDYMITHSEKSLTEAGLKNIKNNSISGISILVGCIGWDMGNVALCNSKCATNQQINSITDIQEKYNPYYIYYWLSGRKDYLFSIASVTRTPILSKGDFEMVEIPLPPKQYQDMVADVLLSIDKKIALNNAINDNLQHQLQTLYDYWFAQFDFPDENGRPYRSSGGQMVWCEELKREIPLGWEVKSLSQLIKKNSQPFDYASEQPTIDLSVMPSNSIALSDLNNSSNFTTNLYMMKRGDILFGSIRPYLHKAGIAPCDGVFAGTVHSYSVLEADNYNFALFSICRDAFFDYAVNVSAGTKMPVVSSDSVLAFKVPYSAKIAHSFNQISVMDIITKNVQENQRLIKLRDWLLPMLMNGQATIED